MATPAPGGAIRTRVENIGGIEGLPNRNAGFDVHLGPLGDLDSVTIDSRTVQTQAGDEAQFFLGLYLDVDEDGEFFVWENGDGNTDRWGSLGGDEEGVAFVNAGGSFTIDAGTGFFLVHREETKTLEGLQNGVGDIDGETPAALYIGVVDKEGGGPEEAVIEDLTIERA